jgi:hypothetical protein
MSTLLNFGRDNQGMNAFAPAFSQDVYSATLAATTDTTLTVPSNSQTWLAVFSVDFSKLVWVAKNATAAIPAGSTFASTTSELINPYYPYTFAKVVQAGDVLHFFSESGTANISVAFYALSSF